MKSTTAIVVWGNQLTLTHNSALRDNHKLPVIIIESKKMCRKFPYHKQKLMFILTAMRDFKDKLIAAKRDVIYQKMEDEDVSDDWFVSLEKICKQHGFSKLIVMRQNDRSPQRYLESWSKKQSIELEITPNTMFLTSHADFEAWAENQKRLQLEQFYRWQRERLDVMVSNGKPDGGKWNYDTENRHSLPKDIEIPKLHSPKASPHLKDVMKLVSGRFKDNPGNDDDLWLPTSHDEALQWLDDFIEHRFENFGKYEDAMRKGETFLYHSVISPLLNIGLLHPEEVLDKILKADVPIASKEGFVRQVIGWREFMFSTYHHYPAEWISSNYLDHRKKLEKYWWQLDNAPEAPLQDVLSRVKRYGYSHRIERLMVVGNYMLLAGYNPKEIYRWFMSMYVDAYEWVMVPNVIGMSQYADGGIDNGGFATKPYISGSNYLQKMGHWWPTQQAAKDARWADMYWDFLARHEKKLKSNYRLMPLYRNNRSHQK